MIPVLSEERFGASRSCCFKCNIAYYVHSSSLFMIPFQLFNIALTGYSQIKHARYIQN